MPEFAVNASAGMLFPEPQVCPLAGETWVVDEFRVREVGAVENAFTKFAKHPHAGLEGHFAVLRNRKDYPRERIRAAGLAVFGAGASWPPKMGSGPFNRILATIEGTRAFLWVALMRGNRIEPGDIAELIEHAEPGEIRHISHVCWGIQAWEVVTRPDGEDEDDDDAPADEGMKWGSLMHWMSVECGYSYQTMGDMYLSQWMNAIREGKDKHTNLPALPGTETSKTSR